MEQRLFRKPSRLDQLLQGAFDRIAFPLFLFELLIALIVQPWTRRDQFAKVLSRWD